MPKKITDKVSHLVMIDQHGCAITDGRVVCAGANYAKECDVPSSLKERDVVDFELKPGTSCAILKDGGKQCWGDGYSSEIKREILLSIWNRTFLLMILTSDTQMTVMMDSLLMSR